MKEFHFIANTFLLTILHIFVLFVSILLRISVLSQFHNKFTIRSAKEDIAICTVNRPGCHTFLAMNVVFI